MTPAAMASAPPAADASAPGRSSSFCLRFCFFDVVGAGGVGAVAVACAAI